MPIVSVVIPCHNRGQLIGHSIRSVLDQSFADLELIVVDDGSSDDTTEVLSRIDDPRLRVVSHEKQKGAGAARNAGITEARGKFVALLDSDDEWVPEKLERQLKFIREWNPPTKACCTDFIIYTPYHPEGEVRHNGRMLEHSDFLRGCGVSCGSTLLAEKTVFESVGLFDESLKRLEDWDWLLRYTQHYNLPILPEALSKIDFLEDRGDQFYDIVGAVAIMAGKYVPDAGFSYLGRLKFAATLENELAVGAYRAKRYRTAFRHLLKSFCYWPYRSPQTIKRVVRGVWHDVFRRRD